MSPTNKRAYFHGPSQSGDPFVRYDKWNSLPTFNHGYGITGLHQPLQNVFIVYGLKTHIIFGVFENLSQASCYIQEFQQRSAMEIEMVVIRTPLNFVINFHFSLCNERLVPLKNPCLCYPAYFFDAADLDCRDVKPRNEWPLPPGVQDKLFGGSHGASQPPPCLTPCEGEDTCSERID
jgi:hypothetical protein